MEDSLAGEDDDDPPPGPFDSLLVDDPAEEGFAPEPGDEDDPDADYDPLPGFADVG
jgi:hypothetical protein